MQQNNFEHSRTEKLTNLLALGWGKKMVQRLAKILFQVGENNINWHKDASRDGEIKLIRGHVKIDVKIIPGTIFFAPHVCL